MCSRFTLTCKLYKKERKKERKKEEKVPFDIKKTSLYHIETRALDEARSKAEADAMGN